MIFADKIVLSIYVLFRKCHFLSVCFSRYFAMTCRAVAEKRDIISFKDKLITHPICDQYEYK